MSKNNGAVRPTIHPKAHNDKGEALHLARAGATIEFLANLFVTGFRDAVIISGVPSDATFQRYYVDDNHGVVWLVYEGSSFPLVLPDEVIPSLDVTVSQVRPVGVQAPHKPSQEGP